MRSFLRAWVLCLGMLVAAAHSDAEPVLQLDILGGTYDPVTETIVASGPEFTLVALLTPRRNDDSLALLADTYYISAAIVPMTGPADAAVGSFTWNGETRRVTEDMEYGVPPLEAVSHHDDGDLPTHGIYPTYFSEFAFQFSADNRTTPYNTAETPGALSPTTATTGVAYYQTFHITTSLAGSYAIHFDLYDSYIQECGRLGTCETDIDVNRFAPFSHDAQSGSVPEPTTLLMLSLGAVLAASHRRFFGRSRAR